MATQIVAAKAKKTSVPKKAKLPKGIKADALMQVIDDPEYVEIPVLTQPYRKAPEIDPYLKPETVTQETLTFGDVSLPPTLSGIQPGHGLSGEAVNYQVKVIHVSRRQIEAVLREVGHQRPELQTVLKIVSSYMCHLDSVRDHAIFGLSCLKGQIKAGEVDKALENLASTREGLGRWHDEHRLHLR